MGSGFQSIMQLLKTSQSDGYAKIRIENKDDLWHLKDFIQKEDRVRALTQRTKLDGRDKKTCTLTLKVEKTEYTENRLRVTGEITEGTDDIELGYHTFNLEEDSEFEIQTEFTESRWERLQEMEDKRSYQVLFCLVEKGSADFFLVEESGISDLSKIEETIPGKMYSDQESGEDFHKQVAAVLKRSEDVDNLILCGPGFQKRKVHDLLDEELKEKTFVQNTSVTGKTGLHEAFKLGALDKVVEKSRIGEESAAVEEFLEVLQKDGDFSYGEPVEECAEMGAVETLLITAEKNRENPKISKMVERQGGETQIVHVDHEAGEKLDKLGGLAAILRYPVQ